MVILGSYLCTLAGNGSYVTALAAVTLLSFGLAVVSVSISIYASKVASEADYGRTVTTFQFLNACGGLLFGRVPGMIADARGTYIPAYMLMMSFCCVGALVMVLVYRRIRHEDHIYVRAHRRQPVNLAHMAKLKDQGAVLRSLKAVKGSEKEQGPGNWSQRYSRRRV